MFKIITSPTCRFCTLAKSALAARGLDYEEEEATPEIRAQLVAIGLKTVPQIYFYPGGAEPAQHIGGFEDLKVYFEKNDL